MLLAGDVGATKTKLGLFLLRENLGDPLVEATFQSAEFPDVESILRRFLSKNQERVSYVSLGVAGPVVEGEARITNLPWVIRERDLKDKLQLFGAHLLNDVEAIALSVPFLAESDTFTLNRGENDPTGVRAIIAAGTGLGEAFITCDESGSNNHRHRHYSAHPSEGGHADFAPTDDSQVKLLQFLLKRFDHVSYEEVCSGIGIRNMHGYFEQSNPPDPTSWHSKAKEAEDPVPLIAGAALRKDQRCECCIATFDAFVSILGAEAGNLALKVLATGGVYLAGSIPRKTLPLLETGSFVESFRRKGRLSRVLSQLPVHVVMTSRAAILGAARSGMEQIRLNNPELLQGIEASS